MRDGIEDVVREKERAKLRYPFEHGPQVGGAAVDVAPGVKWLRMPLGGALSFINVWAIEDNGRSGEDAWAIVDTGMGGAATRDAWCWNRPGRCQRVATAWASSSVRPAPCVAPARC